MSNKEKKEALEQLDSANKEYKKVCSELKKKFDEYDKASDEAIIVISEGEKLLESIRKKPWSFNAIKKKIAVNKKKFIESKELRRKERNKNIAAGITAGGVLAGGVGFFVMVKNICKKDIFRWILLLAFIVIVLAVFLMFKLFNRISTAKKAYKQIEVVKAETDKNRTLFSLVDVRSKEIETMKKTISDYYRNLKNCSQSKYKELSEDTKNNLAAFYNLTLRLTELVNSQIG